MIRFTFPDVIIFLENAFKFLLHLGALARWRVRRPMATRTYLSVTLTRRFAFLDRTLQNWTDEFEALRMHFVAKGRVSGSDILPLFTILASIPALS